MSPDIVQKSIPELRVAAIRRGAPVPGFEHVPDAITPALVELFEAAASAEIKPTGPLFVFYEEHAADELEPIAALPIGTAPLPRGDRIVEMVLPPTVTALGCQHLGGLVDLGRAVAHGVGAENALDSALRS